MVHLRELCGSSRPEGVVTMATHAAVCVQRENMFLVRRCSR